MRALAALLGLMVVIMPAIICCFIGGFGAVCGVLAVCEWMSLAVWVMVGYDDDWEKYV